MTDEDDWNAAAEEALMRARTQLLVILTQIRTWEIAEEALLRARTQLPDGSYIYGVNEVTLDDVVDLLQDVYGTEVGRQCAPLRDERREKSGKWRTRESGSTDVRTEWHMRRSNETGWHKGTKDWSP